MNNKYLSLALVGCAIAFSATPLKAEEKANAEASEAVFVCANVGDTPTMFAYNPGQVNLTPAMSWYPEYLLPGQSGAEICQQTATKLQSLSQQEDAKYLKAQATQNKNLVCLVSQEDKNCGDEDSEKLFSVNPKFNAGCVLENKTPIDCQVYKVRGVYSFNDEPYQVNWWLW
jgi:Circadian oscillating protein COP23